MKNRRFINAATELIAPVNFRCIVCGKDIFDESGFCADCLKELVFNNGKTCLRCGVALDGEEDYCGNCAFDKTYFDKGYSPFCYEGAIRSVILDLKFHQKGAYAKVLAKYLAFVALKENLQFDVVTFVPMSAKSLKKRGYNQARLLAEQFCDILNIDALCETVVKIRDTQPQEKLSRTERKTNLVGCFRFSPQANVKGKRVLLIDDIKTTGATVNECAKVLKRHGATSVIALTVASRREKFDYENEQE